MRYNYEHHITPKQVVKPTGLGALASLGGKKEGDDARSAYGQRAAAAAANPQWAAAMAAEPAEAYGKGKLSATPVASSAASKGKKPAKASTETLEQKKARLQAEMKKAAAAFDFIRAAQLRDELLALD